MSTTIPYDDMSTPRTRYVLVSCCYVFPARIGCILLGYLSAICTIVNIFAVIIIQLIASYFHVKINESYPFDEFHKKKPGVTEVSEDKNDLTKVTVIMMVMLCFTFAWLILNIAALRGIHKNRPGPVILYFVVGIARAILAAGGYFYLIMNHYITNNILIISYSADFGVAVWFLMIYYHYGLQLKREVAILSSHIEQVVYNNDNSAAPTPTR